jgi:hypothetical protein
MMILFPIRVGYSIAKIFVIAKTVLSELTVEIMMGQDMDYVMEF